MLPVLTERQSHTNLRQFSRFDALDRLVSQTDFLSVSRTKYSRSRPDDAFSLLKELASASGRLLPLTRVSYGSRAIARISRQALPSDLDRRGLPRISPRYLAAPGHFFKARTIVRSIAGTDFSYALFQSSLRAFAAVPASECEWMCNAVRGGLRFGSCARIPQRGNEPPGSHLRPLKLAIQKVSMNAAIPEMQNVSDRPLHLPTLRATFD